MTLELENSELLLLIETIERVIGFELRTAGWEPDKELQVLYQKLLSQFGGTRFAN